MLAFNGTINQSFDLPLAPTNIKTALKVLYIPGVVELKTTENKAWLSVSQALCVMLVMNIVCVYV